MPSLLPEKMLEYMIQLARGQDKKELLKYRINPDSATLTTEGDSWNWIDKSEGYWVWLLDPIEADKKLRSHFQYLEEAYNVTVPRVLKLYIAETPLVQRGRGRPIDRDRELKNVKLRAKVEITKRFMKKFPHRFPPGQRHEKALKHVAEEHGMTRDALSVLIYPRKRRKHPRQEKSFDHPVKAF